MANFAVPPNYRAKPNLKDLADLSLSQGDILYYDGTNLTRLPAGTSGQYLKTQGAGANPVWADVTATVNALNDIGDVTISSPADNEVLAYDSGTGEWINQTPAEAGLAEASHTHSASDITSGQIGAAYGGTGIDSSAASGIPKVSSGTWSIDATTDDLSEGSTNLYFTDARAISAVEGNANVFTANQTITQTGVATSDTQYPSYRLQLVGSSWDSGSSAAVTKTFYFESIGMVDDSRLGVFNNSGTEVLTIKEGGNVGIGTTSPSEKLEVNGNVKASGAIIGSLSGILKASSGSVSGDAQLNDLGDASISSPSSGHYLRYDGTNWVNSSIQAADLPSHTHTKSDITDTVSYTHLTLPTKA